MIGLPSRVTTPLTEAEGAPPGEQPMSKTMLAILAAQLAAWATQNPRSCEFGDFIVNPMQFRESAMV